MAAYKLDAGGKCRDDKGRFAKTELCAAAPAAGTYKLDSKSKCRDVKGKFCRSKTLPRLTIADGLDEVDIWRTAKVLMDAHGENAVIQAAMRADHALADGNSEAEMVWRRVLRAIEELQRSGLRPGEPIN